MNRERPPVPRCGAQGSLPVHCRGQWKATASPGHAWAPSNGDSTTVLGGVKGSLAALGGSAALDPACPRGDLPLSTAIRSSNVRADRMGRHSIETVCRP
jgi:hypothetical protein